MNEFKGDEFLEKIRREERKARRLMYLFSLIPVVLTVLLFFASWNAVNKATRRVNELKAETGILQRAISLKSDSIAELKKSYEFAVTYEDKKFRFNYSIDKELFSRYPAQTRILEEIRSLMSNSKIKWHLGGKYAEEGFDSPGFARYILNKYSKTVVPEKDTYNMKDFLETTGNPTIGDIIFYEHGYTMFYFEYHNTPFCVGMTPVGVTSLQLNFGPAILGYGKVNY